tara:strand:- start:16275 stop:16550 length:276 start_codon:yes stop_codon:yes gene_type:complete
MIDNDIQSSSDILNSANNLVSHKRRKEYGEPKTNFKRTAIMFSAYKGIEFTAEDVCMFMVFVKLAREAHKSKMDNKRDAVGYLALAHEVKL